MESDIHRVYSEEIIFMMRDTPRGQIPDQHREALPKVQNLPMVGRVRLKEREAP